MSSASIGNAAQSALYSFPVAQAGRFAAEFESLRQQFPGGDIFAQIEAAVRAVTASSPEQAVASTIAEFRSNIGAYGFGVARDGVQDVVDLRLQQEGALTRYDLSGFTASEIEEFIEHWILGAAEEPSAGNAELIDVAYRAVTIGRHADLTDALDRLFSDDGNGDVEASAGDVTTDTEAYQYDISHEKSRIYLFPQDDADPFEVVVDSPKTVFVTERGEHCITDKSGIGIVVPPGWVEITIEPEAGQAAFSE